MQEVKAVVDVVKQAKKAVKDLEEKVKQLPPDPLRAAALVPEILAGALGALGTAVQGLEGIVDLARGGPEPVDEAPAPAPEPKP